jgi:hypothetical protein
MMTPWERARRALATRLCMRFAARHVAVEDVPHGLEDVIEPFPTAAGAQEEQQQEEREKSVGAASPMPASARRVSRSGSQSSVVRYLSPLVSVLRFYEVPRVYQMRLSVFDFAQDRLVLVVLVDISCVARGSQLCGNLREIPRDMFPSLHNRNAQFFLSNFHFNRLRFTYEIAACFFVFCSFPPAWMHACSSSEIGSPFRSYQWFR